LAKQQRDNLSCLGVSHFAFGRADYDWPSSWSRSWCNCHILV